MAERVRLNTLEPGEAGTIEELLLREDMKRRLLDMGFTEGTSVECVYRSPFGDPAAYFVKGTLIAVRNEDSRHIFVERKGQ